MDPNGFAGYLFVKNKVLQDSIANPLSTIKYFDEKYKQSDDSIQLTLFDMNDTSSILTEEGEFNEEN